MKNKTEKLEFEGIEMRLQAGDILTSKKGFLSQSPLTNEWYIFHKVEYRGNGCLLIIGDKKPVDVKRIRLK